MYEQDNSQNNVREFALNLGSNPQLIDEVSTTLYYLGYALTVGADQSKAVWKIKKIEQIGTVWQIQYANGDDQYQNIWNNRSILNYR